MDNYLLIALIIIVFWIVGFAVYIAVSNRQRIVEGDLNRLSNMLEDDKVE